MLQADEEGDCLQVAREAYVEMKFLPFVDNLGDVWRKPCSPPSGEGATKYAIEYRSIFIISLPTNQYECLSSVEN